MSVYFITCGPFIKVGYFAEPERRVANLFRSGSRYTAPAASYAVRGNQVLLRAIDGDKNTEAAVHRALEDFAAGCEWFVDEPAVRDFIATAGHDRDHYRKVRRDGGPVELPHAERGGCNVAALPALARTG